MRLLAAIFFAISLHGQTLLSGIVGSSSTIGGTVATPTDSPGAGTYGSTQSVTLSDATGGSTICYTIDGSTPGAGTPGTCDGSPTTTYSGAISVATTTTVKAIGTKAGMTNSGVLTSVYTITPPGPSIDAATCNANHGAISADMACTFSSSTTASVIVVFISFNDFGPGAESCTDSQLNTYTTPTNNTALAPPSYRIQQFVTTTATPGTLTVTCTYNQGATQAQILAVAVNNATAVDTGSPSSATATGITSTVTTGPINTSTSTVVLSAFLSDTDAITATAGNICGVGATDLGGTVKGSPPLLGLRAEGKAFATLQSSCNSTWTQTNADTWASVMVAVK